ncbi:MAG: acyl carrier protein [Candidatus Hydrogenedentes bacterium]|nr:acyl carrier protein [Candidatus Hydrogenedentota bacterium]
MNDDAQSIQNSVKDYLLKTFLPGEDPDSLTPDTPLISGGILDSISTVKLVTFLEEQYKVEFQAHEISSDTLETLTDIAKTIQLKSAARA